MTEALLTAILNAAARWGFGAVATFLESRGSTIDDAIAALRKAQAVSLEQMIAEDAAARLKAAEPNAIPPA